MGSPASNVPNLSGSSSTATGSGAAETLNAQCGLITTESLTTAAAGVSTRTLTNSLITANSLILVWIQGGTNTRLALIIGVTSQTAGSCVITITNAHASALNGTLVYGFLVL